jgi:hypothetical protein
MSGSHLLIFYQERKLCGKPAPYFSSQKWGFLIAHQQAAARDMQPAYPLSAGRKEQKWS